MRIIALMNQKGGVGKTTTTVNLGAALAEGGKRVLLIDLDPQAHLTINYGVDPDPERVSLYDVLVEEKPLSEAVQKVGERIDLVASSIDLAAAEVELVSVMGREMILKKRLEALGGKYDFVLFDCPPSLGLLTINALAAASEVIIPMQPHFLAMQGVAKLLETVQLVNKRMNPGLKVAGIVLTMFDAQTKLSTEVVAELQRFIEEGKGQAVPWAHATIFKSKIRRNIKLAECPGFGQPVTVYDSMSNGAADYRALAKEVVGVAEEVPAVVVKPLEKKEVVVAAVPKVVAKAAEKEVTPAAAPKVVSVVAPKVVVTTAVEKKPVVEKKLVVEKPKMVVQAVKKGEEGKVVGKKQKENPVSTGS